MKHDYVINDSRLMKEWDWDENKAHGIFPDNLTCGSGKLAYWKCSKGHQWKATIIHRTYGDGTNCPVCNSGRQTSLAEQSVFYYVKKLYPDAINRYKAPWLNKMELDIFIPSINYAIEYDGIAWHVKQNNIKREQEKYRLCHERNIKLIRLREKFTAPLSNVADYQFGDNKDLYKSKNLEVVINQLLSFLNFSGFGNPVDVNIDRDKTEIINNIIKYPKVSFESKFPELAKEWDYQKNGNLKPNMFAPYSDIKGWWICPICNFSYQATFGHRAYGTGCPKCGIEKSRIPKCKRVQMIDSKTNEIIKEFQSISDASRIMKINYSNISMVCNGQRKTAGGYHWKYGSDK